MSNPNLKPLSRHLFLCQSARQWQAIINARFSAKSRSPHLFTLRKKRHTSSSWAGMSPNFRREIRQSHYRNDPVKYDLNYASTILSVWKIRKEATNWWAKIWNYTTRWFILVDMSQPSLNCCSFLITLTLSKVVLVHNSAPSIVGWLSFSIPRARNMGILFPFLHISFKDRIARQMAHVGCTTVTIIS